MYIFFFYENEYTVFATIKVGSGSSSSINIPGASLLGISTTKPGVVDETAILQSRRLLKETISELGLVEEFKKRAEKDADKITVESVADELQKNLAVETIKDSSLIKVSFTYDSTETAYNFVKLLISKYIQLSKTLSQDQNTAQKAYIEKVLPQVEKELSEIENKLIEFQEKNKNFVPSEQSQITLQKYSDIKTQVESLNSEIRGLEQALSSMKTKLSELYPKVSLPENITSPELEAIRSELIGAQIKLETLLTTQTENSKEVQAQKNLVNQLQIRFQSELKKASENRITTGVPVYDETYAKYVQTLIDLESKKTVLAYLEKILSEYEKEISALPKLQQEFIRLKTEYTLKQATYSMLKQKLEEVNLNLAGFSTFTPVVIDEPEIPRKPSGFGRIVILALAGIAGLFLGIIGGLFRDSTDKYIRDKLDFRTYSEINVFDFSKDNYSGIIVLANAEKLRNGKTNFVVASFDGRDELISEISKQITNELKDLGIDSKKFNVVTIPNILSNLSKLSLYETVSLTVLVNSGQTKKEDFQKFLLSLSNLKLDNIFVIID
nr:GNVR domain-containing protein [Fervidobacterium pennivorans]